MPNKYRHVRFESNPVVTFSSVSGIRRSCFNFADEPPSDQASKTIKWSKQDNQKGGCLFQAFMACDQENLGRGSNSKGMRKRCGRREASILRPAG